MRALFAILFVFVFGGCNRGPALDQNGDLDVVYERVHGQGATTDYLHVSTKYEELQNLSVPSRYAGRWIYYVHPHAKKEFMQQVAASMKRNRVDMIGKRTTTVEDVSTYRLRVRGSGLAIDTVFFDLRPSEDEVHALWNDEEFTAMRRLVSDLRLMAELYAVRWPEKTFDPAEKPNQPSEPTSGLAPGLGSR